MEDCFPCYIVTALIAFIVGAVIVGASISNENNTNMNRALSCMANGNTVAQCQTVLGLEVKLK